MGDFVSFNPTSNLKGVYGDFSLPKYTEEVQENTFSPLFSEANFSSNDTISKLYGHDNTDIRKYADGISFEKESSIQTALSKAKDFASEGFTAGINLFNLEKCKQDVSARNDGAFAQFDRQSEATLSDCTRFYLAYNTTF